jgi:hypothetical protein
LTTSETHQNASEPSLPSSSDTSTD